MSDYDKMLAGEPYSTDLKELMFGGGKGGGKSMYGVWWVYSMCHYIIKATGLDKHKPNSPIPVGFMGRKVAKTFKTTTLQAWLECIPPDWYTIKGDPAEIVVHDRVKIETGGLDKSDDVKKFNSAQYCFYFVDQAEEVAQDDIAELRGSLRRKINGIEVPFRGLLTSNPRQCWLKTEFIDKKSPNKKFIPALFSDNPHLPSNYKDTMMASFSHRPELVAAYVYGNWSSVSNPAQIITAAYLEKNKGIRKTNQYRPKFIVCDPARMGDDDTVFMLFEDDVLKEMRLYEKIDATRLNHELDLWAKMSGAEYVIIESNGIGGPVIDWQRQLSAGKYEVIDYNASTTDGIDERCLNKRADLWWKTAEFLSLGEIGYNVECLTDEQQLELKIQLTAVEYGFSSNGKIRVQSKEEIKDPKHLGRSPDWADTWVIGMRHLPALRKRKQGKVQGRSGYVNKTIKFPVRDAMAY